LHDGNLAPVELSDPAFEVEGLRHATCNSAALGRRGDATFWAPSGHDGPLPLVVLLHGVYGSHWAWAHKAGAHRTAAGLGRPVALAMPSDGLFGLGSGYVRHTGGDFASWILDEVPRLAAMAIPAVDPSAPIALVGLSMGGFGALLLGARHPERVHAVSGLSSITDFSQMRFFVGDISGYDVDDADRSVLAAVTSAVAPPRIRFDCGTSDPLIEPNRELHAGLDAAGVDHTYVEHEGGHEWPYWTAHLGAALDFVTAGTS
jgi:S-formylglutathione hydrolase FrmB